MADVVHNYFDLIAGVLWILSSPLCFSAFCLFSVDSFQICVVNTPVLFITFPQHEEAILHKEL